MGNGEWKIPISSMCVNKLMTKRYNLPYSQVFYQHRLTPRLATTHIKFI